MEFVNKPRKSKLGPGEVHQKTNTQAADYQCMVHLVQVVHGKINILQRLERFPLMNCSKVDALYLAVIQVRQKTWTTWTIIDTQLLRLKIEWTASWSKTTHAWTKNG